MDYVKNIVNRFEKVKSKRAEIETVLQEISDFVLVHKGDFNNKTSSNDIKTRKVYSTAATEANNRLASTIYGGLTNLGSKWFALQLEDTAAPTTEIQRWLDEVNNIMLHYFNSSESGFASQNHEFLLSVTSLGTACMYVVEDEDGGIKFSTIHLSEIYVLEDSGGDIDTVFRKFKYTVRQAAQMWGVENLHVNLQKVLEQNPDHEIEILHVVRPIGEGAPASLSAFKYESIYIDIAHSKMLSQKGFYEMPYIVARFSKRTQEIYGRSPAWDALPTIRLVNQMEKEVLRAKQLRNMPPLLVSDDSVMMPLNVSPNGIIMGGLTIDGTPRLAPLQLGNDPYGVDADIERYTRAIRESFFVDQLYFKEGTPVSATEAVQRQEARLQMLTPAISRLSREYLNKLIETVFSILYRADLLPPAPLGLDENKIKIEYLSPLAKLQKFQDIQALQRAITAMSPLAQLDPSMFDVLNLSESMRYAAVTAGVPATLLRTREELDAINGKKEEEARIQQNMQLAAYVNNLNKPIQ